MWLFINMNVTIKLTHGNAPLDQYTLIHTSINPSRHTGNHKPNDIVRILSWYCSMGSVSSVDRGTCVIYNE